MQSELRCEHKKNRHGNQKVVCYGFSDLAIWTICTVENGWKMFGTLTSLTQPKFLEYINHFNRTGRLYDEPKPFRVGVFKSPLRASRSMVWVDPEGNYLSRQLTHRPLDTVSYPSLDNLLRDVSISASDITWLEQKQPEKLKNDLLGKDDPFECESLC